MRFDFVAAIAFTGVMVLVFAALIAASVFLAWVQETYGFPVAAGCFFGALLLSSFLLAGFAA